MNPGNFSSAVFVEDEPNLAVAIGIALRKMGIPAIHAGTIQQANLIIQKQAPELLLLDRALPDGDGISLCSALRKKSFSGAILMLTAAGETSDRVAGLNSGADDYLPKPFSWDEFEARIKALFRRSRIPAVTPSLTVELWQTNEARLQIFGAKGWVELTPLEYKLAIRLMEAKGAIIGRDELLKDVWGFTLLPKTRTVDHFLGRLRKHFEENPEAPKHFLTVRSAGYRFEA